MRILVVSALLAGSSALLCACGGPPELPAPANRTDAMRDAMDTLPAYAVPDCAEANRCPELGIEAAWCNDDASLYEVTMLGVLVVDIQVLEARVAAANLPVGAWHTVFADPTGGCEATVVSFSVQADEV